MGASEKTTTKATSVLAQRYAKAIFEHALDTKSLSKVQDELTSLSTLLKKNQDLSACLTSKAFSSDDLKQAILAIAKKADFSKETTGFLTLVADNNRLDGLAEFIDAFFELVEKHNNIAEATVRSVVALTKDQTKSIQDLLKKKYKKEIKLAQIIDKNLIGGVVVQMGSMMFDNSIKNKLRNLHLTMKEAE